MKLFAVLLVLFSIGTLFTVQSPYTPSQETSITTTSTITYWLTAWGITVSTDKSTYSPSETVGVSGIVTGAGSLCGSGTGGLMSTCTVTCDIIIELEIQDPLHAVVYSKSLNRCPVRLAYMSDEPPILSYSDSFSLSSALLSGTYQVRARASWSGYPTVQASSSFQLEGTPTTIVIPPTRVWLVLDRQQYTLGDTVEATAWYYGPIPPFSATQRVVFGFYVFDDLGTQVAWTWATLIHNYTATVQGYSSWKFEYAIPTNAHSGLYQAHVTGGLGGGLAPPSKYPGGGYTAMFWVLGTPALGSLSVNFDKTAYYASDTVRITGGIYTPDCTWTYTSAGGLAVVITIYDPNGLLVVNSTTNPSAAGYKDYAYDYVLPANAIPGSYTVAVSYGSCGGGCFGCVFGQGTFQVVPTTACNTITVPPWGITVSTDKSVYGPTDVVQITGGVSGPDCHYYCPCGQCTCDTLNTVQLEIRNAIRTVYTKELTLFDQWVFSDSYVLSYALDAGDYQVIARLFSGLTVTETPVASATSNFRLEGTATTIAVTSPAITTPYVSGAVPGFQLESVFAGLLVGITVLMLFRRRNKQNDKHMSL